MDEPDWNDDPEDIEPVIEAESEFLGALESLNVARIVRCWSDSDDCTMIFPGVEIARGEAAVRSAWEEVVKHTSRLKTVLRPIGYKRLGDLAWTFLGGTLVSTHGDETLSVEVYITNVYHREPGGWKLIHHHASPAPHQPSYLEQRLN